MEKTTVVIGTTGGCGTGLGVYYASVILGPMGGMLSVIYASSYVRISKRSDGRTQLRDSGSLPMTL